MDSFKVHNYIFERLVKGKKYILLHGKYSIIEIDKLLKNLISNSPEIFYLQEWKIEYGDSFVKIIPKYLMKVQERKTVIEQCEIQKRIILSRLNALSPIETVKKLHDIIARNVRYQDDKELNDHTIVGPLLNRKAVCDGFSKLFKYILDERNIPCLVIRGKAFRNDLTTSEEHTWNMVKIDEKWLHVDVTFDATISMKGNIRYDYFLLNDEMIMCDHYFNRSKYPRSYDNTFSPYDQNVYFVSNRQQMIDYIIRQTKKMQYEYVMKLPQNVSPDMLEQIVLNGVTSVLTDMGINANVYISCNQARRIVFIKIN